MLEIPFLFLQKKKKKKNYKLLWLIFTSSYLDPLVEVEILQPITKRRMLFSGSY